MTGAGDRRRTLGSMLVELGRIEEADVERALAYQREHGGFMGEALVALELVTHEEIAWTLAGQFDLPFVRLRAGETDLETARLVDVEWARERNAIPAVRAGGRLTVVLSDPTRGDAVLEEVRDRTGFDHIDLALAPANDVAELIDAAFGVRSRPVREWIEEVRRSGARRFGVTVRQGRAVGWIGGRPDADVPLESGWRDAVREVVRPFPDLDPGEPLRWKAEIATDGSKFEVECTALRGPGTFDWASRLREETAEGVPLVGAELARRVHELLTERGAVVLAVPRSEEIATVDMVALLSALVGASPRVFVIADRAVEVRGTPLVQWSDPDDPEPLEALADFLPRGVVADTGPDHPDIASRVAGVAPVAVVRGAGDESGVDLALTVRSAKTGRYWHVEGADGAD